MTPQSFLSSRAGGQHGDANEGLTTDESRKLRRCLLEHAISRVNRRLKSMSRQIASRYNVLDQPRSPSGTRRGLSSIRMPHVQSMSPSKRPTPIKSISALSRRSTRRRRKPTVILEDSREASSLRQQVAVDWNSVDQKVLDPEVLRINTEAMRLVSQEAANMLRRERGWIHRWDTFDDSSWAERERDIDEGEREMDSNEGPALMDVPEHHPNFAPTINSNERRATNIASHGNSKKAVSSTSPKPRPQPIAVTPWSSSQYHSSPSSSRLPELYPDGSPCSSFGTPLIPQPHAPSYLGDVTVLDAPSVAITRRLSQLEGSNEIVNPIIVVSDWDEDKKKLERDTHLWSTLQGVSIISLTESGDTQTYSSAHDVLGRPRERPLRSIADTPMSDPRKSGENALQIMLQDMDLA